MSMASPQPLCASSDSPGSNIFMYMVKNWTSGSG
jgi:hypothetical protein